jgi:hypothetical protein
MAESKSGSTLTMTKRSKKNSYRVGETVKRGKKLYRVVRNPRARRNEQQLPAKET